MRKTLKASAEAGAWDVALAVLDVAERADGVIKLNWIPDKTMYTSVLDTCVAAARPQEALAEMDRMKAAGFEVCSTVTPRVLAGSMRFTDERGLSARRSQDLDRCDMGSPSV